MTFPLSAAAGGGASTSPLVPLPAPPCAASSAGWAAAVPLPPHHRGAAADHQPRRRVAAHSTRALTRHSGAWRSLTVRLRRRASATLCRRRYTSYHVPVWGLGGGTAGVYGWPTGGAHQAIRQGGGECQSTLLGLGQGGQRPKVTLRNAAVARCKHTTSGQQDGHGAMLRPPCLPPPPSRPPHTCRLDGLFVHGGGQAPHGQHAEGRVDQVGNVHCSGSGMVPGQGGRVGSDRTPRQGQRTRNRGAEMGQHIDERKGRSSRVGCSCRRQQALGNIKKYG